ncbi:bifunctional 4-hydroxy-2-oxoglutarate aldolase/2-dehydro-3-deoxy-phosphogluconate aldolase [Roseospira visakhapatnamensis]|uniref:2-dehydro-3-deoxy-phosphogluconate aldolase n=1 Tax=Roseospira visakhapatnamensis TaxID=390880 RepID=A0A7W6WAD9_9PROT|nr:bifunctional 4-hydroxy-2-oxoglutarate aldolase/2-dehydro-3-deoxy-phosphogluconate aldolase [Roseospira visakhapatnamensis]MBB4267095.1 2-dehydro-3-deoxyphosphogluconate aldolase/(4S)-4-hydroxy-2-oxoglutarate aldolase [Roseospira visakhapatnamensis]
MPASFEDLTKRRIVPVIVIDDANDAVPLAEALLEGGIDIIEITFRTAAAADAITNIAKALPTMLLGAGTVVTEENATRAIDAGVSFGLAPGLNPATIARFQKAGIPFVPGIATPSEVEQGLSLGCKLQKFFPAGDMGGPTFLKALAGPYASFGVKFCPTGGVSLGNMNDYLALPIVAFIGGSWLATKQQIADKDWTTISRQARDALAAAA